MDPQIKILETFRDAIQGLDAFIPTATKVEIIRSMYGAGFDYIDVGSFVSPRFVPQFRDMKEVLEKIGIPPQGTELFILAGNLEGARHACEAENIGFVGFPFSTSETFLRKNINADFNKASDQIERIQELCAASGKRLMVYLAMAFGNPYNDPANIEICMDWASRFRAFGIRHIHLSDIIGVATPDQVGSYYRVLHEEFPDLELGIHLHIRDNTWKACLLEAYLNGCRTFDGVISGLGGCPMTGYEMLANLPTSRILEFARNNNIPSRIFPDGFSKSLSFTNSKLLFNN